MLVNIHKDVGVGIAGLYGAVPDVVEWGREMSRCLHECVASFEINKDELGEFLSAEILSGVVRSNFSLRVQPFVAFNYSALEA